MGETQDRLLAAARDVVAERGWSAATSRAIADRAGVNLALINYHFQSKSRLLIAALDRAMSDLQEQPQAPATDSWTTLRDVAVDFVSANRDSPHFRMLFEATLHGRRDPDVAAVVRVHLTAFRGLAEAAVRAAIDAETLPAAVDASALSAAVAAMLDGLLVHAMIDPSTDTAAALNAAMNTWSRR